MIKRRIVTSCRGSWRWQNAYRIATYAPALLKNGKLVWKSISTSPKYSWPQLVRSGLDSLPMGSLHNVEIQ